jgi:hypothetical protein
MRIVNLILIVPLLLICKISFCQMRTIETLTSDAAGWTQLQELIKTAKNKVELLPANAVTSKEALYHTQVTTKSVMGAVVYYTGGILVDNGRLRILGSGSDKMKRSLPEWNKGKSFTEYGQVPTFLLIADDVFGGFFAVNGGALGEDAGIVYYLAPETLEWESLDRGYADFVDFCFTGDLNKFYESFTWKTIEEDINKVTADQSLNFYPPMWSAEGHDLNNSVKKAVPMQEQYDFNVSIIKSVKK